MRRHEPLNATGNVIRDPGASGLLTDLYQLTMLQAYLERDMRDTAVFEFFVRRLPGNRNFLMAAGLEQLIVYLENLSFDEAEIGWLASTGRFSQQLLDYLTDFRFRGELRAMPEGTVFFADEPVVQVIAPLPEAQLIESRLINLTHFQTLVASKAARCVLAAPGKLLVDFGLRRAHGAEAGLLAARAAYLAGFSGTATVLADAEFGIPTYGTMAHSFIQAHEDELQAFEHFARTFPGSTVLLIDTYDTLAAAQSVTKLAPRLRAEGIDIHSVRLDSGDLPSLAVKVREILDSGGCEGIRIFCSGSIDEYMLAQKFKGLPVDGFGIGTHLVVSADAPYLDCAYKLQEYAGIARRKRSTGKATWPGRKQVFRHLDDGLLSRDIVTLDQDHLYGEPLLETVMRDGRRVRPPPSLESLRQDAAVNLARLPPTLRSPVEHGIYDVQIAPSVRALAAKLDKPGVLHHRVPPASDPIQLASKPD
jgi:nicotinate phosphoribosyltransferase